MILEKKTPVAGDIGYVRHLSMQKVNLNLAWRCVKWHKIKSKQTLEILCQTLKTRFGLFPIPLCFGPIQRLQSIRKIINFWYTFGWKWWVISFHDYLGLSNACSYDVDDVIGRAAPFGFQNFCSPGIHNNGQNMHLFQLESITISFHAFDITFI